MNARWFNLIALALLLYLAVATSPAWAQEQAETPQFSTHHESGTGSLYDVRQLVEVAQKNADVLREHSARINKAQWTKYRADWAWGPKLNANFFLAPVPERADTEQFSSNLGKYLSLNIGPLFRSKAEIGIPLYTFDRISNAKDLADLGVDVAKIQREKARLDLMFQVKRAYFSVQLANAFQTLLGEGNDLLKDKLADMEEARDFGEADFSTKDFRKLQIFNAEFDTRVLDNEKLHDIASEGVKYLTRVEDFRVRKFDDSEPMRSLAPLETYREAARRHRPDWKLLDRAVRARDLQVELAKSEFYPNIALGLSFGFGWSTEEIEIKSVCRRPTPDAECVDTSDLFARPYSNPFNFNSFGIALLMDWNFDFWQLRGKFGEAKAERAATSAQRDRAIGAIELEVRKIYIDALKALERVEIEERRLEAARRWRDQFGLSVESGGAEIEDGIDPLKAYFEAKARQLEARYEYQIARASLAQAVGVDWLEQIEPSPGTDE